MELTLTVYTNTKLKEVENKYTVNDFELSTKACEDLLNLINIDMFEGGLEALSEESRIIEIIKPMLNGRQVFYDIIKDVFDVNDDQLGRTKISEILKCLACIIKYSLTGLVSTFKGKN